MDLRRYHELLKTAQTVRVRGRVTELTGLVIKAAVPNVRIGEVCIIKRGSTVASEHRPSIPRLGPAETNSV